jgi:hypothetical protein
MPETINPLEPSGFDLIFPIVLGIVVLAIVVAFVALVYFLFRDRTRQRIIMQQHGARGRSVSRAAALSGMPGDNDGDGIPGN